ncbi:multicopper oxidase family protein [Paenibacillus sp. LHD-38]|uniref:multicopper oxidase family protein n=1 Tax=Paenibacillus sp. LHD-38 TaxID=3072143 RepID=UPI00280C6760|nr:multicopper oxidase family protein [Paenibacillus sp. LHD-38]MDQ8734867.1 multicopper oxidase family protein [Paenibacillus sp. LHD-38]
MRTNRLKMITVVITLALVLSACTSSGSIGGMDHTKMNMGSDSDKNEQSNNSGTVETTSDAPSILTGPDIALTAAPSQLDTGNGKKLTVWSYNNTVPGPQIRVKKGETVRITLTNKLDVPTSIHWHGVPVPNSMDGIPGVTQNAVQPGESFEYKFKTDVPGTYWYHSHQDSVNQLDMGLYGSFIVEDPSEKVDRDYTLVLDEWMSSGTMNMNKSSSSEEDMAGMNHGDMEMDETEQTGTDDMQGHDMSMYDLFTINGKTGSGIEPLLVKEGEKVRIRLINAGYISHQLHLHGHEFKVMTTDGQPVQNPAVLKDQLITLAPGERYDIEFEANNPGQWYLEEHGSDSRITDMKIKINYEEQSNSSDKANQNEQLPSLDLTQYGKASSMKFTLDQKYDMEYTMKLGTEKRDGEEVYTINGDIFPETEALSVKTGDTVKVRLVNTSSTDDHPMHLHGHFFQVLSKNGQPVTGSPIVKDTINLKPGEEAIVAFEADNPGNWMFHCHDLHHASAGMMTELNYSDFKSTFVNDPNAGNMPE